MTNSFPRKFQQRRRRLGFLSLALFAISLGSIIYSGVHSGEDLWVPAVFWLTIIGALALSPFIPRVFRPRRG